MEAYKQAWKQIVCPPRIAYSDWDLPDEMSIGEETLIKKSIFYKIDGCSELSKKRSFDCVLLC